jgi:hypothetical protein
MVLSKIEHGILIPRYADTGNSQGFYCILPGYPSYVCLNESLLEGSEEVHQLVYKVLIDYHKSIPVDSKIRVFELVRYFEELGVLPIVAGQLILEPLPEIVFIGRAFRPWRFTPNNDRVRIIG